MGWTLTRLSVASEHYVPRNAVPLSRVTGWYSYPMNPARILMIPSPLLPARSKSG